MTNKNCEAAATQVAHWLRTQYKDELPEMVASLDSRQAAAEELTARHYGVDAELTGWIDAIIKIEGCEQPCTPERAIRLVLRKIHDDGTKVTEQEALLASAAAMKVA